MNTPCYFLRKSQGAGAFEDFLLRSVIYSKSFKMYINYLTHALDAAHTRQCRYSIWKNTISEELNIDVPRGA